MIVLSIIFVSDNLSSCVVGDKKYIVFGGCKYREPVARELFAWSAVDHVTTCQALTPPLQMARVQICGPYVPRSYVIDQLQRRTCLNILNTTNYYKSAKFIKKSRASNLASVPK